MFIKKMKSVNMNCCKINKCYISTSAGFIVCEFEIHCKPIWLKIRQLINETNAFFMCVGDSRNKTSVMKKKYLFKYTA